MKKVLFTTEDGVIIYEGDKYFSVKVKETRKELAPLYSIVGPYINPKAATPSGHVKYFSTRESAEEFILKNKNA